MKEKLASQEVELLQKNEDADKLIQVVGVETEKVRNDWFLKLLSNKLFCFTFFEILIKLRT